MAEKFYADVVTRSGFDQETSQIEITVCDPLGRAQTLSLSPLAAATLSAILADRSAAANASNSDWLTKLPTSYAVGHGRHEPMVMLRFEDEPAYGLSAEQAADLGEALLEEAEALSDVSYPMHQ